MYIILRIQSIEHSAINPQQLANTAYNPLEFPYDYYGPIYDNLEKVIADKIFNGSFDDLYKSLLL